MSAAMTQEQPEAGPPISNFRDAGGWDASGGRMTTGWLFRSAAPGALGPLQSQMLARDGIGALVDLRGLAECEAAPTRFAPGADIRLISTPIEPRSGAEARAAVAEGRATRAFMRELMLRSYRGYAADSATAFGDAIAAIVASDRPVLVHCTAGKDRTGFLMAVLQRSLGVADDDVLADYLRTNLDWDRKSAASHLPIDAEIVAPILEANTDYLDAAFAEIARLDGSVHDFIRRATGGRVSARRLDRFIETRALSLV